MSEYYGSEGFRLAARRRTCVLVHEPAPGTQAAAWVPRTTHVTASQALTPQEAHGRRSSNGRQEVLASRCARQGQSTRRAILAVPMT